MIIQRKRVAKRLASGLLAGALALGGLAISSGGVSARTPVTTAKRVQGTDRYSTAVALAGKYVADNASWKPNANLILASGENFPDALAASALSKLTNAPILLTSSNSLPASVRDWVLTKQTDLSSSVQGKVYVVGGTSAVSEEVVTSLLSAINTATDPTPHTAVRLAGENRYETAKAINAVAGIVNATDAIVLVNGSSFADAVSAAPLAYSAGWPIIPVSGGAIDANGLATITAIVTANGGDASLVEVLIMGGEAAIPVSVEQQLAAASFAPSKIVRVQGADRYATSLNLNAELWDDTYGGGGIHGVSFNGSNVALASGENFPDALAAGPWLGHNKYHLQLTNSSALNPNAAGLLSTLAQYDTNAANPTNLWAIGGEAAVSASNVTAAVAAAQSVDVKITSMTCREEDGLTNIDLGLAEAQSTYKYTNDDLDNAEKAKIVGAISKDGLAFSGLATTANLIDKDGNGVKDTIRVTASALSVGLGSSSTIAFAGVTEIAGTKGRAFGSATCVAVDDSIPPQASIVSGKGSGALTTLHIKGNEELDCSTLVGSKIHIGRETAVANTTTISATSLAYAPNYCKLTLQGFTALATTTTVSVQASAIKDVAGNYNSAISDGVVGSDLVKPTVAAGSSISCKPTAGASVLLASTGTNGITVSATSHLLGGSKNGVAGNSYKVSIVNQRGLLLPSVTVDDTAKTIVITADTAYHKAADVKQTVANRGGNSDWTFSSNGTGALAATSIPLLANTATSGTQDCTVKIYSNEILGSSTTLSSVTANGLSLASGGAAGQYNGLSDTTVGDGTMFKFTMRPTTEIVAGSVAIAGTFTDVAGNAGLFSVVI